ncbi:MAG: hypothetical protein ACOYN8_10925 [Pseudanabaena sp.]|jgi:hypothetical protein
MTFTIKTLFIGLAIAQITSLHISSDASARPMKLAVHPTNSGTNFPICPTEISITEQGRPYYEGGYTIDGSAKLDWLAGKFKIVASDEFSVTWGAKLQRKYQNCQATAGIAKSEDEPFQGHSYLRMRFTKGNAYLILDMTAMYDANRLTPVIIKKEVKDGNPIWTWAGTD